LFSADLALSQKWPGEIFNLIKNILKRNTFDQLIIDGRESRKMQEKLVFANGYSKTARIPQDPPDKN
jgi:hypothetical protein